MKKLFTLILALVLLIGVFPAVSVVPAQAATRSYGSVPILIGDPETDLMADRILAKIPTAGLSDRNKILKVYDWIITHCKRTKDGEQPTWMDGPTGAEIAAYSAQMLARVDAGQAVIRKELASIYTNYTYGEKEWSYDHKWRDSNAFVENYGNYMMHTYNGTCVDFSSLFAVLLGHLGYDARTISGAYINKSGPVAHTWNLVLIGNKYYWFDIRIDHAISQNSSSISHAYFMKSSTNDWERTHIWARGYTNLLEANVATILALYEADNTHNHMWEDDDWKTTATCETFGLRVRSCKVCKLKQADYLVLGHDWTLMNSWNPTCTAEGGQNFLCRRCFKTASKTIPATGHRWRLDQVLTPAQEGEHGTASYVCTVCKAAKQDLYCAGAIFSDMPAVSHFAHAAIDLAFFEGITTGTSATAFSPNKTCTRAQAVTFLWRAMGKPNPVSTKNPFTDVTESDYYYQAVLWAAEQGITKGTGKTSFSPHADCTREQVVTFLWRAKGSEEPASETLPFEDVAPDSYARNAILWAVENGITNGTSKTTFSPHAYCSRAGIVTFLYRAIK